jgi:hypothetical protein
MWIKFKPASYPALRDEASRTHLKNRILVQDRGGAEFQTGGILLYVEDLKRGTNKDIGTKDIFEMGSNFMIPRGSACKLKHHTNYHNWEAQ